jgi:hypothetical protein
MIGNELHMSKEIVKKILIQDLGMKKLDVKLVLHNLTKEQKDRPLTLCMDFAEQLEVDFWIMSSLVMKHGVISMIR